jgi:SAM-dependent methyltransferase
LVDLSQAQMEVDRSVAKRQGLEIELIEADMLDLSVLRGRHFDLVYQPVSACYVPDVRKLYRQVAQVLRPSGYYRVEHWNPYQMQLDPAAPWDGQGYRLVEPQGTREPVPLTWSLRGTNGQKQMETLCHYIHPLHDLIGGLCDAGFNILRYAERLRGRPAAVAGTYAHLRAYAPSFLTMFAQIGSQPS